MNWGLVVSQEEYSYCLSFGKFVVMASGGCIGSYSSLSKEILSVREYLGLINSRRVLAGIFKDDFSTSCTEIEYAVHQESQWENEPG